MNFEKIKAGYESGKLTIGAVRVLVRFHLLTKDQYKEITGQDY